MHLAAGDQVGHPRSERFEAVREQVGWDTPQVPGAAELGVVLLALGGLERLHERVVRQQRAVDEGRVDPQQQVRIER